MLNKEEKEEFRDLILETFLSKNCHEALTRDTITRNGKSEWIYLMKNYADFYIEYINDKIISQLRFSLTEIIKLKNTKHAFGRFSNFNTEDVNSVTVKKRTVADYFKYYRTAFVSIIDETFKDEGISNNYLRKALEINEELVSGFNNAYINFEEFESKILIPATMKMCSLYISSYHPFKEIEDIGKYSNIKKSKSDLYYMMSNAENSLQIFDIFNVNKVKNQINSFLKANDMFEKGVYTCTQLPIEDNNIKYFMRYLNKDGHERIFPIIKEGNDENYAILTEKDRKTYTDEVRELKDKYLIYNRKIITYMLYCLPEYKYYSMKEYQITKDISIMALDELKNEVA